MDVERLQRCTLPELEALYLGAGPVNVPAGWFRGIHLRRLDRPWARRPGYVGSLPFSFVPFGIDFDRRCWTFLHPRLGAGRFSPAVAASRWRPTTVVALHYGVSRLPRALRRVLYDEIKPLSAELCLGLGGLRTDRGPGDHFFFALCREAAHRPGRP